MSTPADLEQEQLILDSVGRFLDREVKPHVHALEHDDIYPAEIVEGMKALGLFGATIGADYGGRRPAAADHSQNHRAGPTDGVVRARRLPLHPIIGAAGARVR